MEKPKVSALLSVVAFLTATVAAANFYVGRNAERARRIWTEDQLQKVTQAKEILEKERDELTHAKQALEEQLADSTQQARTLADQLAQEKRARDTLTAELTQSKKEATQYRGQVEAERGEKLALTEDLAKAKQSYQSLSNELTTLRQAKEALERRVKEMLMARAKEAEQIVVRPSEGIASSAPGGPPRNDSVIASPSEARAKQSAVEGKVLVVNREFDFVVVNLGSKDGIQKGSRFSILKADKRVGTVEVERLYENMAAANVLEEEKKGQIQEGDTVRLVS